MTQLEIYKEALEQLRKAEACGFPWATFWRSDYYFSCLCTLIDKIALTLQDVEADRVEDRFVQDSEKVLGRKPPRGYYWFTEIEVDEPKARAERLEHLENLIKLYEDGK